MPRLLVLNNYPLDEVWAEVKRGEAPDQLLFGVNRFAAAGWEPRILPMRGSRLWRWAQHLWDKSRFPLPLGDLAQQREALRQLDECDLIYAACQTQTQALSFLRSLGLVRRPIVCLAHHPLDNGRLAAWRAPWVRRQVRGTDAFPSLSRRVADQINALVPGRSAAVAWGPDTVFYPPAIGLGRGILATGRTGRDFETFGRAATRAGVPAVIACPEICVTPAFRDFGPTVEVRTNPGRVPYSSLIRQYAVARALAIPHFGQANLVGLSSLLDALGMGKPVIMTRHPLIDLEIEKEGIGRWVEPGDVEGWAEALSWFDRSPEEAAAMGRRARSLVEAGLNSERFAQRLLKIFAEALA